jgi:hypothetical protein
MNKRDVIVFVFILMLLVVPVIVSSGTPTPSCTDTDGGDKPYNKGTVTYNSVRYIDNCITEEHLEEYYCGSGGYQSKNYFCTGGCENGVCKGSAIEESCADSDEGINYLERGTIRGFQNGNFYSYTDECVMDQETLRERYCTDLNQPGYEDKNCREIFENGICQNGECVEGTTSECFDTDGGRNYKEYGEITLSNGTILKDYCKDNQYVAEYSCYGEPFLFEFANCEGFGDDWYCSGGACVEGTGGGTTSECFDSDGGNQPYYPGYVSYSGEEYRDFCNSNTLTEYYCDSGQFNKVSSPVKSSSFPCPRGYTCSNYLYQAKNYGYCKPITPTGSTTNLLNGKWIKPNVKPESELFSLSLTESQLGTTASKVGLKVTKTSSTIGVTTISEKGKITGKLVAPNPDENTVTTKTEGTSTTTTTKTTGGDSVTTSSYPVTFDIYKLDKLPTIKKTVSQILTKKSTNSFLSIIGRVVGIAGSNPGSTSNYLNFPTHIKTLTGTMTNNEAIVYWTITESDMLKAGSGNSQQFYFKAKIGNDENSFLDKTLTVNVDWSSGGGTEPPTPVNKRWLDNDKTTVITKKSINWHDLTPTTRDIGKYGSQTSTETNTYSETKSDTPSITGNLVIGDSYLNYKEDSDNENMEGTTASYYVKGNKNLIYMDASNLGVAPGTLVYFNVYEKDSHEGGEDDPIRIGSNAIRVSADQSKRAVAPLFLSQDDILAASTSDGREVGEGIIEINLEFYYEVVSFSKVGGQNSGFLSQIKQTSYDSFITGNLIDTGEKTILNSGLIYLTIFAETNTSANYGCTDTDGGLNYSLKGTATSTEGSFTDVCLGTTQSGSSLLQEYTCDGENVIGVMYSCPPEKPCVNGACGGTMDTSIEEIESNKTGYLVNSEGVWKNKDRTEIITEFNWSFSNEGNVVTAFVSNLPPSLNGQDIQFSIWEDDSIITEEGEELTEDSVSEIFSTTITEGINLYDYQLIEKGMGTVFEGEVYFTWEITKENLYAASPEEDDRYEFYFGIKLQDGESKIFKNKILYVYADGNVVDTCGNGICESWENEYTCPEDCLSSGGGINTTGDECENINYCADHLNQNSCENPCMGALENEIQLNNYVDCSNESIDCTCAWIDDSCSFVYNQKQEGYGSCLYVNGKVIDNCLNTGTLIITYNAIWNWNLDNCYETKETCEDAFGDGYSFGTKCLDREGCWRQADSSYDQCKDYQETKECSTGGEVVVEPTIKKESKKWYTQVWFYMVLAILIILLVLLILWFLLKKKNKQSKEEKLFKNKNNLFNIMNYINSVKRKGMPDEQIRANLKSSGWKPEQIKYAMHKYSGRRKFSFRIFNKRKKTPVQ